MLEIGRALNRLIEEGRIPRPRRNLRFWWVNEISSQRQYFADHPEAHNEMWVNINQDMVGATTVGPRHKIHKQVTLGDHMTEFVLGELVPLSAPNCGSEPQGPDLVLHFKTPETGLIAGLEAACIEGRLNNGVLVYGCDEVNAFDNDKDGLSDAAESTVFGTDSNNPDSDGDNLIDGDEVYGLNNAGNYRSDPAARDSDGDWIRDDFEVGFLGTDPMKPDTDGDSIPDFWEALNWVGPTNPNSAAWDPDGDGYTNLEEFQNGTNPRVLDP
jgi:hypothetical protein